MNYVGDYSAGSIVYIYFNTFSSNDPSASVTMTNFVNTDVHIHKNDNLTQRNDAAGITVNVDVDGIIGSHFIKIDTSDDTISGFFVSGADYNVRIEGVTIDGATINAVVGSFSIENRHVAGVMLKTTIATLASQTSFTLTAGSADNGAYSNCTIIVSDLASSIQKAVGQISGYTGSTRTIALILDPAIFTMAVGDNVSIIATSALANIQAIRGTSQSAGDISALITTVDTVVDGIQTDLDNGTDGLGALKTLVDTVNTDLSNATDGLGALKTLIDTVNTDLSNSTDGLGALKTLIDALENISAANVNAELVDVLKTDIIAELSQAAPTATPTFETALMLIYMVLRNKLDVDATNKKVHNDAGTVIAKKVLSDDGTTYSEAEMVSGP